MLACFFPRCTGHDEQLDAVQHSLQHLLAEVAGVKRLARAILTKEGTIVNDIHAEIAEALQPVVDAVSTVSVDVAQELTDFANQIAPKLSDDEKAQFAGIATSLLNLDATVKAADPGSTATGDPGTGDGDVPPVDTTPVDGSTDDGSTPSV